MGQGGVPFLLGVYASSFVFWEEGAANICSFRAWDLNNHHAEQCGEVEARLQFSPPGLFLLYPTSIATSKITIPIAKAKSNRNSQTAR